MTHWPKKKRSILIAQNFIEEIEDVALVHQLLISKLRTKNNPENTEINLSSPFYKKSSIRLVEGVNEVDPEIDELNKILILYAPIIESETTEQKEQRKLNLKKEFLPVIASMNTAVSKELFNWFVSTADPESIEKFISELSNLKKEKNE